MKKYARYLVVLGVTLAAHGVCAEEVVELWQGQPPHFKSSTLEEYVEEAWGVPCAHNVTKPTLTIYPARGENSGTAIVVLPGGGYVLESIVAEGSQIAEHLAAHGITAAVLKYRLPLVESSDRPQLVPEADARRAIWMQGAGGAANHETIPCRLHGHTAADRGHAGNVPRRSRE